jgi:hypothetical protein
MLEQVFLMDLDVHGLDGSLTDRLVAAGALSQSKVQGLPTALSDLASDISAEESARIAAVAALALDLDNAETALQAAITSEESRALAAEGVLSSDIASETAARISAVAGVQSNLDSVESSLQAAIDAESARALAAEAAIIASAGSDVSVETARALAAEAALQNNIDGVAFDLTVSSAGLSAAISSEASRAQAEEADIRIDFAAGDAATLSSAESYTDQKIADLVNSAPALLDTLGEIATALEAEQSATASILTSISNEVTRATAAEGLLDGRLDVIEAKQWRQAVILSASQGVTTLAKPVGAPAIPNVGAEVQVFIDGRKVFFGSQFSVAVGGGSITFSSLRQNQTVELLYWA